MKTFKLLAISINIILLSGCTIQRINEVQDTAIANGKHVSSLMDQANKNRPVVEFHSDQWINPVPMAKPKYNLPDNILNCQMVYKTITPQDIYQFSQDITDQCRVRTRITPDASSYLSYNGGSQSGGSPTQRLSSVPAPISSGSPPAMIPLNSFGTSGNGTASEGGSAGSQTRRIADVSYSGNVAGLLDIATARLGISWKYENGAISFYYLETKRFDIKPADAKYQLKGSVSSGISTASGADGGGGGGGGGGSSSGVSGQGGSTTTSDVSMGNNLYADLKSTAESMLTPGVGRLSMNQTTGTVMVTDVPEVVKSIGEYLDNENISLTKQVMFKVVVYTYNSERNDLAALDWNLVFKSLSGQYGINLANTFSGATTDAVSGGASILDTATGRAGQFAGSSFLFNALSQQVNVSDVKTQSLMTTNMAAVSVLIGQQLTYLKSVTSTPMTSGTEVVNSETLTPGSVTTGTNITILPKILNDSDTLMLSMFMDISSLKQLRKISSKDQSIEGPDLNTNAIPQRVWMKAGQTLILSGYDQDTDNSNKQGVGSPNNIALGGGLSGSKTKQSFVITVTPFLQ